MGRHSLQWSGCCRLPWSVKVCSSLHHGQFIFHLTVIEYLPLATIINSIPCEISYYSFEKVVVPHDKLHE